MTDASPLGDHGVVVHVAVLREGRVEYSDMGSGPPVLVIHGAGSDGRIWASALVSLTARYRLVAYSRRGFQGSGPTARSWTEHAADAAALLQSLQATPAAVVAHSSGCIVALELAVPRPELVARLVLLDPAVYLTRNMTPRMLFAFSAARVLGLLGLKRQGAALWYRYANGYQNGGNAFDRMPPGLRAAMLQNAAGVFADFAIGDGSHPPECALTSLLMPIAIVSGELSQPFLHRAADYLARRLPQARRYHLAGAGHALAFDRHVELISLLVEILASPSAPAQRE